MRIGLPKEVKDNEYRVAITPGGVRELVQAGHSVRVETHAGQGSGFTDEEYARTGAILVGSALEAWNADLVVKVKEPQPAEYRFMGPATALFTYLHLAADPELTRAMLQSEILGIAYETVEQSDGSLPLLYPMSEVAGRLAPQAAATFLEKSHGGRGKLFGGVPGVRPADVIILGAGVVGTNAAQIALGMGANVTLMDVNSDRLRHLDQVLGGRLVTLSANAHNIAEAIKRADAVIGAVLVKGARAPQVVTREMVRTMKPGTVIVDVAVDQGGCCATSTPTTHSAPIRILDGVIHYGVTNMPGAVPRTSTYALSNATLPYLLKIAQKGMLPILRADPTLRQGVNVFRGRLTYAAVAQAHGMEFTPLESLL